MCVEEKNIFAETGFTVCARLPESRNSKAVVPQQAGGALGAVPHSIHRCPCALCSEERAPIAPSQRVYAFARDSKRSLILHLPRTLADSFGACPHGPPELALARR